MTEWKFEDPLSLACITQVQIMHGDKAILHVTHDDDGYWQFLDGEPALMREALVVGLHEIVSLDASVNELADLPYGWYARRDSKDTSWQRAPKQEEDSQ